MCWDIHDALIFNTICAETKEGCVSHACMFNGYTPNVNKLLIYRHYYENSTECLVTFINPCDHLFK